MTAGEQRIEALLRSAAPDDAAWPPTPDLRAAVAARIAATAASRGQATGPASRGATRGAAATGRPTFRLVRGLVIALVALLVLAGIAAALGFGLPGVTIDRVDRLPPAGSGFDLGSPMPLAEARNGELPRLLVPAALPEPATAFVQGFGSSRIVTLAWRADPGEPVLPGTDLRFAISAVAGRTDDSLLSKMLGPGTTIEPVAVGGDRGWWIAGAPHDLVIRLPDGTADVMTSRFAGDTLVFARAGTLYRLESTLGRDATIAVAESLR